jgi:hypothetical protein
VQCDTVAALTGPRPSIQNNGEHNEVLSARRRWVARAEKEITLFRMNSAMAQRNQLQQQPVHPPCVLDSLYRITD